MNQSAEHNIAPENNKKNPSNKRTGLFFIVFLVIGLILLSRREAIETIDCSPEIIAGKPDVIMLGAWWCTYCYQAKKYFQKNNIHYCEYDMESTTQGKQLYEKHGGGAIPILLIGKYQISGFNEQQVETALTLLKQ